MITFSTLAISKSSKTILYKKLCASRVPANTVPPGHKTTHKKRSVLNLEPEETQQHHSFLSLSLISLSVPSQLPDQDTNAWKGKQWIICTGECECFHRQALCQAPPGPEIIIWTVNQIFLLSNIFVIQNEKF